MHKYTGAGAAEAAPQGALRMPPLPAQKCIFKARDSLPCVTARGKVKRAAGFLARFKGIWLFIGLWRGVPERFSRAGGPDLGNLLKMRESNWRF